MSNIRNFSSKSNIRLQACEWISKLDRGLNENEVQSFSAWVNTSETHRQTLFDMAQTWDDLSVLHQLNGLFPLQASLNKRQPRKSYLSIRNLAASVLLIGCLAWLFETQLMTLQQNTDLIALDVQTTVGEDRVINLADGSVVHLNTDSHISVDFSDKQRNILLVRGEAHFDVAHDEQRAFIVKAGDRTVTAVGTAFNVQLDTSNDVELIVTDGKVLVKSVQDIDESDVTHPLAGNGQLVTAGYKAIISKPNLKQSAVSNEEIQHALAWQQGMLVFHGEPLSEALKEITRYTSIQFDLADEQVKQRRVAGYFKAGDISGLLFALENNFNIIYTKLNEQTIVLSSGS
jgi:transmembrane sensor